MTAALAPLDAADRFLASLAQKPVRLLVAISGGSDSTGLLLALKHSLARSAVSGISLSAATIDHALRPTSAGEALEVAKLCADQNIPHFIRRWDGEKPGSGLSMAAREARYRLLGDIAAEIDATAIVTGHTLDDQLETILMRATRSNRDDDAGLSGMADAVLVDRRHWVLRPLLQSTRADIRQFLSGEGVPWIDDPSNDDSSYERVRIRQDMSGQGPGGQGAVDLAFSNGRKRAALSLAAAQYLRDHASGYAGVLVRLDAAALVADPDILRHALSHLSAVLGGRTHSPGRDSLDRVLAFLAANRLGRVTAGRTLFDRRRDGLFLLRENRDVPQLVLAPQQSGIWDGRFQVENTLPTPIVATAAPARSPLPATFAHVPPGIAARASRILPQIRTMPDGADVAALVPHRVVLGPYDRFLPRFDLALADQIAALLDREPYISPPC